MKKYFPAVLCLLLLVTSGYADSPARKKVCVSPSSAARFLAAQPARARALRAASDPVAHRDGSVVILEADPELLIVPNPFDMKRNAIRFTPALTHRYVYALIPYAFNAGASDTLTLKDDDSVDLPFQYFQFPFAGKLYSHCFVNSNGNLTFDQGDTEPPNIETLLDGPPRIAPFFDDLDPETSGTVFVQQSSDAVIVSWLKVPEFFSQSQFDYGQNTFQVVLYRDGRIDMIYSEDMTATQALVGIVPGYGKSQLRLVDFTKANLKSRPVGSLVENFHDYESIDIPQAMKALYKTTGDKYDFVTLFSNFDLTPVPGAAAFALNVQNDVRGIGNPASKGGAIFKNTAQYGSAGKLQNITFFGNIHQYPADPNKTLPDTYTSLLQMMAHEIGHRWLSYVKVSFDGAASNLLLGRDLSHWSFFYDSDGSFLEGNQITQKSANSFLTSRPFTGYSGMDLYLMGLIPATDVPSSFVVLNPGDFSVPFEFAAESSPEPGIEFQGSAHPVTVNDVIAVNGPRKPDATASQKTFNHLFVLIVRKDNPASPDETALLEQWRSAWEGYFSAATAGKGKIQTNVQ